MATPAQIRKGASIVYKGEPYVVIASAHHKMGRGGAVVRTKLKNLKNGSVLEATFKGDENIEIADLSRKRCQFLYNDDSNVYFMDEAYEQFSLGIDILGDSLRYLKEGQYIDLAFWNNKPMSVKLPPKVDLEVVDAPPAVKGDTATNANKTVKLATGLEVLTPLFINRGDIIRINTETGEYVERV